MGGIGVQKCTLVNDVGPCMTETQIKNNIVTKKKKNPQLIMNNLANSVLKLFSKIHNLFCPWTLFIWFWSNFSSHLPFISMMILCCISITLAKYTYMQLYGSPHSSSPDLTPIVGFTHLYL